jgi:hypothetical protein
MVPSKFAAVVVALGLAVGCTSPPAPSQPSPPNPGRAAWARIQAALPGTWTMPGKKGPFTVSYKLISGGSTLVETWGVGSGKETMTVFHPNHDELVMTHYCAQGNQPRLRAASADDAIRFRFVDATNIEPSQAVLVERTLRFGADAFDDTEVYKQPDGTVESTTYHFTRSPP